MDAEYYYCQECPHGKLHDCSECDEEAMMPKVENKHTVSSTKQVPINKALPAKAGIVKQHITVPVLIIAGIK